jgi:hypothetical protein
MTSEYLDLFASFLLPPHTQRLYFTWIHLTASRRFETRRIDAFSTHTVSLGRRYVAYAFIQQPFSSHSTTMGRNDTVKADAATESAQSNAALAGQKIQEAAGHAWDATKDAAVVAGAKIREGATVTKDVAFVAGTKLREGAAVVKDALITKAEDAKDVAHDVKQDARAAEYHAESAAACPANDGIRADARELNRDLNRPVAPASENVIVEAWHATMAAAGAAAEYIGEGASAVKESIVGHSDDAADVAHDAKHKAKEVGHEAADVAHDTKWKVKMAASHKQFKAERKLGIRPHDPDSLTDRAKDSARGAWIATKEKARDVKEAVTGKTEPERIADDVKDVACDAKEKTKEVAHDVKVVLQDTAHDAHRNMRREGL